MFPSLRGLRLSWLPRDAIAGLMLLAIALPGQLATARLAGMPPETGIVAFMAGSLAFAAFGASRFMSVGADSTTAPIFAGALAALAAGDPSRYVGLAGALALMVGTILIVAGVLRAGWIADLLSVPVTVGFLTGIAVHIIVGQLPAILGVNAGGGHVLHRLSTALRLLPEANLWSSAIGALVLAAVLAGRRISARVPGAMIGLLLAATAVWQFDLACHGVAVLGALSMVMPRLSLPALGFSDMGRLLPLAVTVTLVCMMQIAAVARSFPSDPDAEEDVSRDFAGVGAGSLLAGMLGVCMAVTNQANGAAA